MFAWLTLWRSAKVPLQVARREWLKRQVKSSANIANACCPQDQHELCAYRLTGQLLDASTGSVPMFALLDLPDKQFDYTDEEEILATIAPRTLMDTYRGLKAGSRTLMTAGVAVVRRRVEALRVAFQAGTLRVQVQTL